MEILYRKGFKPAATNTWEAMLTVDGDKTMTVSTFTVNNKSGATGTFSVAIVPAGQWTTINDEDIIYDDYDVEPGGYPITEGWVLLAGEVLAFKSSHAKINAMVFAAQEVN